MITVNNSRTKCQMFKYYQILDNLNTMLQLSGTNNRTFMILRYISGSIIGHRFKFYIRFIQYYL